MLDATRENRIGQLARACTNAGVPLPKTVEAAREKVTRIAQGRIQAETALQAANAKLAADVVTASAISAEKVADTILGSDAMRYESMRRLHETDVMATASAQASASAISAIVDAGPDIHAALAAEFTEYGGELAKVAKKCPVDDLRNADQVVRLGGSAAADAAAGLNALARLDAIKHASHALARCGYGFTGAAPELGKEATDLLRVIDIESLDDLDTIREEVRFSGKASPMWTAVRNGYTLTLASPDELEQTGREIGLAWQAREDQRNPYRRHSLS